jgi:hypothetical protein
MDMRKINWKVYEKVEKEEIRLFLEISKRIVWKQKKPKGWKKKRGPGRPPYDWKGLVVLLLLKVFYRLKFRETASFANGFPDINEFLELEGAPSRSTLQRAMNKLDVAWLRKLNDTIVAEFKKNEST